MKRRLAALAAVTTLGLVAQGAAAAAPVTCTAGLTIFTTSQGTVTQHGPFTHFTDSGVGGSYTSGFLAGYTLAGAQDITLDNLTHQSRLHGSFVATGPDGTVTVRFNGRADLTTGAATGNFQVVGGTGSFGDLHWRGTIAAQLVSLTPPTFLATDSGPCRNAP
jgi:hypothetical protein